MPLNPNHPSILLQSQLWSLILRLDLKPLGDYWLNAQNATVGLCLWLTGAESVEAVQKLMSLTDRVRPHDSKKHPLPASASLPAASAAVRPLSPFRHRRCPLPSSVALSPDSSSLSGMYTHVDWQLCGVESHIMCHIGDNIPSPSLDRCTTPKIKH